MSWLLKWAAPWIDGAIQRAIKNPRTTFGGGAVAIALEAVFQYLESQGCALGNVHYVALVPFVQGALSTDGPSEMEDAHTRDGGNAF